MNETREMETTLQNGSETLRLCSYVHNESWNNETITTILWNVCHHAPQNPGIWLKSHCKHTVVGEQASMSKWDECNQIGDSIALCFNRMPSLTLKDLSMHICIILKLKLNILRIYVNFIFGRIQMTVIL